MQKKTNNTNNKKRIWSAVLRFSLMALVAVVVGVNVYLWNAKTLVGNSLPMPFGVGAAVVLSGSMEPTLSVDDLIVFKRVDDCETGDIIVFQDDNQHIVHRVVRWKAAHCKPKVMQITLPTNRLIGKM